MKKIIVIIIIILLILTYIIFTKKEDTTNKLNISNVSELTKYEFVSDDMEMSGNLFLICNQDECNFYNYDISLTEPIEVLKTDTNEYLPNIIHFGKHTEEYFYPTNDKMPSSFDLLNDFYLLYNRDGKKYKREIKINGKVALNYETNNEYTIYKDSDDDNYFIVSNTNSNFSSTYIIDDNKASTIYTKEKGKKVILNAIVYNYKNGTVIKKYSFELNKPESYEDSLYWYNDKHTLIVEENNKYKLINLNNYKELTVKDYDFSFENYVIIQNKIYDKELNLVNELDKNAKIIVIDTIKDYEESKIILYENNKNIYNIEDKLIYTLKENEKYYSIEDAIAIYNDKYIVKIIDSNGKVLLDNENNKYNIKTPKKNELYEISSMFDKNSNIITFDKDIHAHARCIRNNNEIDYDYTLYNKYFKINKESNNIEIIIYDEDLNIYNKITYDNKIKIESISHSDYYNGYISFDINIKEDNNEYTMIYLYDIKNNKLLFDKPLTIKYETNAVYSNGEYMIIITDEKIYFVKNNIISLNNDINANYITSYYKDNIIFESNDNKYIIADLSKLK